MQRSNPFGVPNKLTAPSSVVQERRDSKTTGGRSLTSSGNINKKPVIKRLSRAEMADWCVKDFATIGMNLIQPDTSANGCSV